MWVRSLGKSHEAKASITAGDPIWHPMLCEWNLDNLVTMLVERDIDQARIAALTADPV